MSQLRQSAVTCKHLICSLLPVSKGGCNNENHSKNVGTKTPLSLRCFKCPKRVFQTQTAAPKSSECLTFHAFPLLLRLPHFLPTLEHLLFPSHSHATALHGGTAHFPQHRSPYSGLKIEDYVCRCKIRFRAGTMFHHISKCSIV